MPADTPTGGPESQVRYPLSPRMLAAILSSLVAVSALCYSNALSWDSFHLDDDLIITERLAVESQEGESSVSGLLDVVFMSTARNRPVANASFILSYWLGGGLNGTAFRLVNLLVHVLTAVVIFFLVRRLLNLPRALTDPWRPQCDWKTAWVVALIWAAHPIQVQAVTYVVQRMTSLATFLSLLSILLFLKGWDVGQAESGVHAGSRKRVLWFGLSGLAFALGVGSKETALLTIPSLGLLAWTLGLPRKAGRGQTHGQPVGWSRAVTLSAAGIAIVTIGGLSALFLQGSMAEYLSAYTQAPPYRDFNGTERILTQGRVLLRYVGLLCVPLPASLNVDHHVLHSQGLLRPWSTVLGVLSVVAGLGAGAVLRRRNALLSYGVLFFLLHHAIECLHPVIEMMFEHRNYAPSMGFILVAVVVGTRVTRGVSPRLVIVSVVAVVGLLSVATYWRNFAWETRVTLWQDAVEKSPGKYRPNVNLAIALLDEYKERRDGRDETLTEAESLRYISNGMRRVQGALKIARKSGPADVGAAHENLSHWHEARGDTEMALVAALEAERAGCHSEWLPYHIGNMYFFSSRKVGQTADEYVDRAEEYYREAVSRNNASTPEAYFGLFHVASKRSDERLMLEMLNAVLNIDANHVDACVEMGQYHRRHGRKEEAEQWLRKALSLDALSQSALGNLAGLLCEIPDRKGEASAYLLRLLAVAPNHPQRAGIEGMLRGMD